MSTPLPGIALDDLQALLLAHSTPGDEQEVADILIRSWTHSGLQTRRHGRFAISATLPESEAACGPAVLVCAHMDSPGYTVETLDDQRCTLIPLGGAHFEGGETPVVLKTASGKIHTVLRPEETPEGRDAYFCQPVDGVRHGDRACFLPEPDIREDGVIRSPFLDNRLGCFLLCELGRRMHSLPNGINWILGATACEEMGGFGAPVLAHATQPDTVFCVDATYEAPEQNVRIDEGPVLTLSDASVLLSPAERDRIRQVAADNGIPLQTEVYNVSGTDARAFPHAGLAADVYALLMPSADNHTPAETASLHDWKALLDLIPRLGEGAHCNS